MQSLFLVFVFATQLVIAAPAPKPAPKVDLAECLNDCPNRDKDKDADCTSKCLVNYPCKNNCCVYETTTIFRNGKPSPAVTSLFVNGCGEQGKSTCYPTFVDKTPQQMPSPQDIIAYRKSYELTAGPCAKNDARICEASFPDELALYFAIVDSICANHALVTTPYPVHAKDCEITCQKGDDFTIVTKNLIFSSDICVPWLKKERPKLDKDKYSDVLCGACPKDYTGATLGHCKSWYYDTPDPLRDAVMESIERSPPSFLKPPQFDHQKPNKAP